MTPFEEELKRALVRREPSAAFTARVLAKVAAAPERRQTKPWLWRFAAVAAAVLAMAGGTVYQQHEHDLRGESAKRKLLLAMRIAGSKLHEAQQRVKEVESAEVRQ